MCVATAVFDVLADPNRRRILEVLRGGPRPVGELVVRLRISQPAVSKHLRLLREAGFVSADVDAQRRIYSLRLQALQELDEWLAPYRALWSASLDRLERRLDQMEEQGNSGGTHAQSDT